MTDDQEGRIAQFSIQEAQDLMNPVLKTLHGDIEREFADDRHRMTAFLTTTAEIIAILQSIQAPLMDKQVLRDAVEMLTRMRYETRSSSTKATWDKLLRAEGIEPRPDPEPPKTEQN